MVAMGRVREVDRMDNNEADAAADMGRRRVHCSITDARRLFNAACARWYPSVKELQHFFVAFARTVGNLDDSGVLPCIQLCGRALLIPRGSESTGRFESLWTSVWRSFPRAEVTDDDIRSWLFSVRLLVKFSHFLASLRWLEGARDLGLGVSLILNSFFLYERWAGERLVLEKVLPYGRRAGRPMSVPAAPVGPGIDFWRSCRVICSIFRFLDRLPGGLRRFTSCKIGASHCRLRHTGWEKFGHGLASRPLETSDPGFLDALLQVFGYPGGFGALLLADELPLRYCTVRFALRKPCWNLPECGHVRSLLTLAWEGAGLVEVALVGSNGKLLV